jgi:hypothetical protein
MGRQRDAGTHAHRDFAAVGTSASESTERGEVMDGNGSPWAKIVAESLKIQQAARALLSAVDALDGENWNNQDLTTAADAVRVALGESAK